MIFYIFKLINFFIGACLGSHALVVIIRTKRSENTIFSTSHCDNCDYPLTLLDQIPIISYLVKNGKCSFCKEIIPMVFFYSELTFGICTSNINFASVNGLSICLMLYFLFLISLSDFYNKEFEISLLFLPIIIAMFCPSSAYNYFSTKDWIILIFLISILSIMILNNKFGSGDLFIIIIISLFWGSITCTYTLLISSVLCLVFYCFKQRTSYPFVPFILSGLILYTNFCI